MAIGPDSTVAWVTATSGVGLMQCTVGSSGGSRNLSTGGGGGGSGSGGERRGLQLSLSSVQT